MTHKQSVVSSNQLEPDPDESRPSVAPAPGLDSRVDADPALPGEPSVTGKISSGDDGDAESDNSGETAEYDAPDATSNLLRLTLITALPSWLLSGLLHLLFLLLLALMYVPLPPMDSLTEILVGREDVAEVLEEIVIEDIEPIPIENIDTTEHDVTTDLLTETANLPNEITSITTATKLDAASVDIDLNALSDLAAPKSDLLAAIGADSGAGLAGRGGAAKAKLIRDVGGTQASEAAVARALLWFSKHQFNDGGWNFNHQASRCQGRCANHGSIQARVGATAMALLPYLGAGQTHLKGKYRQQVRGGLYFLVNSIKMKENGVGELWEPEGRMYSHCLATIALCEAYGMTRDKDLAAPAQLAVNYLAWAQISNDGGWRYSHSDPRGDTSVVGWALMALKSAQMAYLEVDRKTHQGASLFLDSVQANGGAGYGYTDSEPRPSMTAIGLLCRMYLGWDQAYEPLELGVQTLSELGPSQDDMYYNYYATQVMRHHGGDAWKKWNESMRDYLVGTQARDGHQDGSWFFAGAGHGVQGGRVYATSMATMILEVYYRHLPIYRTQATEDEFPL